MKRCILVLAIVALLPPLVVRAAPETGSWQIYTMAHGLIDQYAWRIAPDGMGGLWVGHIAGGRGVNRPGGLSHIRADGSAETYASITRDQYTCQTIDNLALAPDNTLWMRLSGIHDYGSTDYLGTCMPDSRGTIGFISPGGTPQILLPDQLPAGMTFALAVDSRGRPWVGTEQGLAVREPDGSWRTLTLWTGDTGQTTAVQASADAILVGSNQGEVVRIIPGAPGTEEIQRLPPVAARDTVVTDIAENNVLTRDSLYQFDPATQQWNAVALPAGDFFGPDLAVVAGVPWLGTPAGLYRLDPGGWVQIPAGETPLPGNLVNDLALGDPGATTLLIATSSGVARLDTTGPSPDPSAARRAFDALWQRTDGRISGSWIWGPQPLAERYEPYVEAPGGARFVRYYDKARMEVTYPAANPDALWYVTNGLLVSEMVRGTPQFSDVPERSVCPPVASSPCRPSYSRVAGDPTDNEVAPTYGDFGPLLDRREQQIGARVATTLTHEQPFDPFVLGTQANLVTPPTTIAFYDPTTGHNVSRAFWEFMQQQPLNWLYLFGHPISEPAWVRARVGGVEQWVLVQLFERRVLTYTPANPAAWQVEMGNVGQHYYQWRSYF